MTRRNFIEGLGAVGAASLMAGCRTGLPTVRPDGANLCWGTLMHLGTNMWTDWTPDGDYPKSPEEEARRVAEGTIKYHKNTHIYVMRDYMSVDWPSWDDGVATARRYGLNAIFVDIGEALAYPSHPELAVKGSLTPDELRVQIAKIRAQGMDVYPKLNFSTGHDQWLREYHWMTGTAKYREVVADLIRDVCEVFDRPKYFHIGYDEESYAAVKDRQLAVLRQGEVWWKDFESCVAAVLKNGARPIMWSDKVCHGPKEFVKRTPREVVMMTWYYGSDFSDEHVTWDSSFELKTDWSIQRNLAASIPVLAEAGFDLMPCTSNWSEDVASEAMLGYCARNVDPKRILGYLTASWTMSVPGDCARFRDGIRQLAEARERHYGFARMVCP